jgi:predicted nuclease of predicted toxin-antitoxin system
MAGLGIRIYLDENLDVHLTDALLHAGYDATHAFREGHVRIADDEHCRFATAQGRAIVSHNFGDFARIHLDFLQRGEDHCGIILVTVRPLRDLMARLRKHLDSTPPDVQRNNLFWA